MSEEAIDRTTLPIRRPPFTGVANQTLDGSQPGWEQVVPPGVRDAVADRRCER
jgi:hypothetical protein